MPRSAPTQSPRRAVRLTHAERRRQLLAHAVQVFAERGYHGTTLELIAEAAGVSDTIVAKHFEDTAALFRGVLEKVRAATLERWRTETALLPDPLARFHAVAERFLSDALAGTAEVRLLHRALAECDGAEIAAPLRAFFLECELFLAGILAEGQQAGVVRRAPDPRVGAWQLLHAGLGLAGTRALEMALHVEPDWLARNVECLMHGLVKTDV